MAAFNGKIKEKNCNTSKANVSFDTAMDLTGVGKFNIGILFLCQLIFLGTIMETLGFSYVLPASQCDLDLDMTVRGWIATIPFMTVIVSSNLWGWFADTYGRKRAIFTSTAIGSTLSIISSFMPELISFSLFRVPSGLFISGCSSLVYTYLSEMTPNSIRDKIMLLGNAALTLGTAFVPLIAWAVLPIGFRWPTLFGYDYRPWRLLVCCFAVPCAIASFVMLHTPESPKFLHSVGRHDEALAVLGHIYEVNTGRARSEYPVSSLEIKASLIKEKPNQSMWQKTVELFTPPFLSKTLLFSFLQFTVLGVNNGFYMWMPDVINRIVNNPSVQSENMCSILNSVANASQTELWIESETIYDLKTCDDTLNTEAFTYTIAIGFAVTVFGIVSAFSLRIVGKRLQMAAIIVVIGAISLSINWVYSPIISLCLFFGYQFIGPCIGLSNAFVVDYYPTSIRATAVGVTLMMGRLGSVVCTNLIGTLINFSCSTTFYLFAGILFGVAVLTLFLSKDKNANEEQSIDEKNEKVII